MGKGSLVLLTAALLLTPATAFAQEMANDDQAAIAAANQRWASAFNAGDAAALAALYTEDATLMAPGGEPATGRDAIQAALQAGIDAAPGTEVGLETVSLEEAGDVLVEVGRYVMTGPDGGHADHGPYLAVWREVDGEWKLRFDIWNSSMPPHGAGN